MRGRNSALTKRAARRSGSSRGSPASAAFEVVHAPRAGVEGRERIDQHDLAVEPREMIAEERPHHHVLVGLVAPLHHRPQRARRGAVPSARQIERREGQRRRAREIARHQEAAGRQQAHGEALVAAGLQIVGEQLRGVSARLLVLAAPRRRASRDGACQGAASCARGARARQREALGRPLLVALAEQRQVEQPFAGIVDDVERERAVARRCADW